jgi:DNA uptake protein ComE-like DNA-binding protein
MCTGRAFRTSNGLVGTEAESVMSDISTVALLAAWIGGTVHAFAIRSRVFATKNRYEDAIAMATQRRELRSAARDTARDPAMAWELRIGRPDLQRAFDDGGLVDVNHAPPSALASLPGMTPELVNRIVETRDKLSGFSSVEELSSLAQLPPSLTGALNEYAIFL